MTINVLAFGIAKEILGGSSVAITITGTNTVNNLKQQIENQYIGIKKLTSFMIAVNGEYASSEHVLKPGDEVAIIPPVSGG